MSIQIAQYNIGDVVVHEDQHFRGVIVDVDADFKGSDEWFEGYEETVPDKNQPWYHVLVDEEESMAYVPQQHIRIEIEPSEVFNPMMGDMMTQTKSGNYQVHHSLN